MKIHEIERHQTQPEKLEIVLHLDATLFWFQGHFAVQPLRHDVTGTGLSLSQHSKREVSGTTAAGNHGDADA